LPSGSRIAISQPSVEYPTVASAMVSGRLTSSVANPASVQP
jgi:hypothetical protein